MYKKHTFCVLLILLFSPVLAIAEPEPDTPNPMAEALQELPKACGQAWGTVDETALRRLSALYLRHQFERLWTSHAQVNALLVQLETLADDGLDPAQYQLDAIRRLTQSATPLPRDQACADIFISHVYLSALGHLAQGRLPQDRIEPLWRNPNADAQQQADERLIAIASDGLSQLEHAFNKARPSLEQYHNLRKAYVQLRSAPLPDQQPIEAGKTLRLGMSDPRVPSLRLRLSTDGYLQDEPIAPEANELYGAALEGALKAFQRRHALQDDGVLGSGTLAALNATPRDRLDQLRVNLERFRWYAADIEPRSLLVDIAGGRVIFFRNNSPQWEARGQVGRDTRQTPSIKSRVTRLTLNPTWTVPPTILREDKLPKIRESLDFLAQHKLQVLDYEGVELDPATVDWNNPGRILLRQAPGPDNPLGRVVIRFANPYSIYLHDTPSQGLFARSQRAFSSGCVRVESVMQLIDLLLTPAERERVAGLLEAGNTYEFRPVESTPILLAYWTAEADSSGEPRYRPDIYRRDQALLAALVATNRDLTLPVLSYSETQPGR